jgi:hypothetical protein
MELQRNYNFEKVTWFLLYEGLATSVTNTTWASAKSARRTTAD